MDREIVLIFKIQGLLVDPVKIQEILNVKTSRIGLKGEKKKNPDVPRTNTWFIESRSLSDDIEKHWDEISKEIGYLAQEIGECSKEGSCIFTVYIYTRGRIPPMCLPHSMLQFAADVGACIDIDHLQ